MADYCISCCSTADLSLEHFSKRDIRVIYFHFELGGVNYLDDCGVSVPPEKLFKDMLAGASTKTSQVSVGEYIEFFEEMLSAGKDILHLSLSSGISGTYSSACIARDELAQKYPNRKIYVVDSLAASSGFGLIMDTLADLRDSGYTIDRLHDWINENRLYLNHWFFSTDLTFYIRGGRVSKTVFKRSRNHDEGKGERGWIRFQTMPKSTGAWDIPVQSRRLWQRMKRGTLGLATNH